MTVLDSPRTVIDRQLVNALALRLGDLLTDERLDRRARNLKDPTHDEEHNFARTVAPSPALSLLFSPRRCA